jgi:hypothetical protein
MRNIYFMVLCSFFLTTKGFGQTSTNGGIYVTADLVAARGDISGLWTWSEANIICNELVDNDFSDWRLPSKEELNFLYELHSHASGNFKGMAYWSSTDVKTGFKATQYFHNGSVSYGSLGGKYSVRCVRNVSTQTMPPSQLPTSNNGGIIVYEKDGHGLVAAPTDLGAMNWESAKTACDNLVLNGFSDWLLPSKEELNSLYENRDKIGGFEEANYWSSTKTTDGNEWIQSFDFSGLQLSSYGSHYRVRAVRSF